MSPGTTVRAAGAGTRPEASLPPRLPALSGWGVAVLFEPAQSLSQQGGDFYDWFPRPDGRLLIALGHVCAPDPVAGAVTLALRGALHVLSRTADPCAALAQLDLLVPAAGGRASAGLCLVDLAPDSGRVRVALAGHPRPWLRRADVVEAVAAPVNRPLGLGGPSGWDVGDAALGGGDALVLCSDGVAQARTRDGRLFCEGPLQDALREAPAGASSYATVLRLSEQLEADAAHTRDDVILAVLRHDGPAAPPSLGELIRRRRVERGLGQAELAARLSVSQQTVSRWEHGTAAPRRARLVDVAAVLEQPVAPLLEAFAAYDAGPAR